MSGWWVARILFVLLVFRDVLKKWLTAGIEALGRLAFQRLAGSRLRRWV